jgi:S1-C subfamily serine protease
MIAGKKRRMTAYRHATGPRGGRGLAIGVVTIVAALLFVLFLAEHGLFSRLVRSGGSGSTLPGVTLGDGSDRMPVVTSVRSNGAAERAGIRAGDEIEAVDGHTVRDVAALRATLLADRGSGPLALHIRRGDTLWTVAIARAEPAADDSTATGSTNGAENPAD